MNLRASEFASFRVAPSRMIAALFALCALSACVSGGRREISPVQAYMRTQALAFESQARARGWDGGVGGSAMATLLNGRTGDAPTPAESYLLSKGETDPAALAKAVDADLHAALGAANSLAAAAEVCGAAASDPESARADLSALERAVIVAKRARTVLASAFDRVRKSFAPADAKSASARLMALEKQIDRLDAAAGKLADRQRGV